MDFTETETMRTQKDDQSRQPRYACKGGGRRGGGGGGGGAAGGGGDQEMEYYAGQLRPKRTGADKRAANTRRVQDNAAYFRQRQAADQASGQQNAAASQRMRDNAAKLTANDVRKLERAADDFNFQKVRPILNRIGATQKGQRIDDIQLGLTARDYLATAKQLGK